MIEETLDNLIQKIDMMHARCFGVRGEFAETLQVVVTFSDNSPPAHLEYYSIGSDSKSYSLLLAFTMIDILIFSSNEIPCGPPQDQRKHTPALG